MKTYKIEIEMDGRTLATLQYLKNYMPIGLESKKKNKPEAKKPLSLEELTLTLEDTHRVIVSYTDPADLFHAGMEARRLSCPWEVLTEDEEHYHRLVRLNERYDEDQYYIEKYGT